MIINNKILKYCKNLGYTLSIATEEKIDEILQLYKDRSDWFKQKQIDQWQHYLEHHNRNEFLKAMQRNELLIISKNNIIVGCFEICEDSRLWNENNKDSYYLYKIVAKTDTNGIGKLIIDICEKIAKQNNKKYLKIDCLSKNTVLNELYNSYGFKLINTGTKGYYAYNLRLKELK